MAERDISDAQILISQLAPSSVFQQGAGSANEAPVPASTTFIPLIPATAASAMVPVQQTAPLSDLSNSLINVNRASAGETRNRSSVIPSNNGSFSFHENSSSFSVGRLPEDNGNTRLSTNRYNGVLQSPAQPLQLNSRASEREHSRTPSSNISNEAYILSASSTSSLLASNSSTAPKLNSKAEKSQDIAPPRGKCKLCNSRESDCLILPCGHLVVCFACVNTPAAAMCPACNSIARSVVRTFLA